MAQDLITFVRKVEKSSFLSIKKKFSSSKYGEITNIMEEFE